MKTGGFPEPKPDDRIPARTPPGPEALIVDRRDPAVVTAAGAGAPIRRIRDLIPDRGDLGPAPAAVTTKDRVRHACAVPGILCPCRYGWSWPEPPAGWTPQHGGSHRAPARTGALRAAEVTNG